MYDIHKEHSDDQIYYINKINIIYNLLITYEHDCGHYNTSQTGYKQNLYGRMFTLSWRKLYHSGKFENPPLHKSLSSSSKPISAHYFCYHKF